MNTTVKIIWSRRIMFLAALMGLFAASYLLYTYTTGADLKCGALLHGCDTVRVSKWASLFGIPTPAFGVFFYLCVSIILIFRAYKPAYKPGLTRLAQLVFAIAGILESIFLTYIQRFVIGQYCTWCLVSAAAATIIFFSAIFDRSYSLDNPQSSRELKFIGAALSLFVVVGGIGFYWLIQPVAPVPIEPVFKQSQIDSLRRPILPDADNNSTGLNP